MKKTLLITALTLLTSVTVTAQNVNIPDANFKAYLVGNAAFNTNEDTEIQVSEALAIGYLDVSALNIADLTGISSFTNLEVLYCSNNQLTSLDVSALPLLEYFYCVNNQLTSMDISANTAVTDFRCAGNQLTTLNVKNGNNANFTVFTANGNPNLACIEVDNAAYSTANWIYVDVTSSFSEECITGINDNSSNEAILIYPNPVSNTVVLSGIYTVQLSDITGKLIVQMENTHTLDMSNQPSGLYLISLTDIHGQLVYNGKLIKE